MCIDDIRPEVIEMRLRDRDGIGDSDTEGYKNATVRRDMDISAVQT